MLMSSNLHIFIFPWLKCHWLWRSTMKNVTPDGPLIGCWPLRGQKRATEGVGGEINKEPRSKQNEDFYMQINKNTII